MKLDIQDSNFGTIDQAVVRWKHMRISARTPTGSFNSLQRAIARQVVFWFLMLPHPFCSQPGDSEKERITSSQNNVRQGTDSIPTHYEKGGNSHIQPPPYPHGFLDSHMHSSHLIHCFFADMHRFIH